MNKLQMLLPAVTSMLLLTACAPVNTTQYAANTYTTAQLNSRQETKTVEIIAITPANILVDNTAQRHKAQTVGVLLGALAGGVVGHHSGSGSNSNTAVGAGIGGAGGALAGSMVKGQVQAQGVSLTYRDAGRVYTSTEIGQPCQFATGIAVLFSTDRHETRIQPNATCPVPTKA